MLQTCSLRIRVPLFAAKLLLATLIFPLFSLAQQKTITGIVRDETGAPLSNVSVIVQGTTNGTQTDDKGHYSISAPVGATLLFSSVNYDVSTASVIADQSEYNVSLKQRIGALSDIVVVGYGRQKKVNLVGSVGTVNVDEKITSRALANVSSDVV